MLTLGYLIKLKLISERFKDRQKKKKGKGKKWSFVHLAACMKSLKAGTAGFHDFEHPISD